MFHRIVFLSGSIAIALAFVPMVFGEINVRIDPTTGQVNLLAVGDTTFVGYELTGPSDTKWFNTSNLFWSSLSDQGLGNMFELTTANPGISLSEGTFSSLSVFDGEVLPLGNPFIGPVVVSASDFIFAWGNITNEYIFGSVFVVPEPGALILLAIVLAAMAFYRLPIIGRRIRQDQAG